MLSNMQVIPLEIENEKVLLDDKIIERFGEELLVDKMLVGSNEMGVEVTEINVGWQMRETITNKKEKRTSQIMKYHFTQQHQSIVVFLSYVRA